MTNTIADHAMNTNDMINQTPSIKITKNTKGYNFEFKILSSDIAEMDKIHNQIVAKVNEWEKNENTEEAKE